jgi:hypothetical protein
MANTRLIQRSFSGGELSPEMFGRIDSAIYQNGAGLMRNFIARPQGPAAKRPGFRYVTTTKGQQTGDYARLISFTYSTTQTMAVELGAILSYSGTITSVTFNTLTVSGTPWTSNQFLNQQVYVGGNIGTVASNTTNTITLTSNWSPSTPSVGSTFQIYAGYARFHTQGQTLYTGTSGINAWASQTSLVTTWTAGGTTLTCTGHALKDGDRVQLAGSAITGGGVAVATTYYIVNSAANTFQLATASGGSALTMGTAGGGTYTTSRVFAVGDLVQHGGYGWYCQTAHVTPVVTPSTTASTTWYRMGAWGALGSIYELRSPYAGPHLMDVHFAQSEDIVTLTHNGYYPYELRRYGAAYWTLSVVPFATAVGYPTVSSTTNFGRRSSISTVTPNAGNSYITVPGNGTSGDSIILADTVYIRGTGDTTLDNKWFTVRSVNAGNSEQISLYNFFTGTWWVTTSTLTGLTNAYIERLPYRYEFTSKYVVTSVFDGVESGPSPEVTVNHGIYFNGNTTTLSWSTVTGASSYNVYKLLSGLYGRIGTTTALSFVDDDLTPDLGLTPPTYTTPTPLTSSTYYPSTSGYFEQRRFFAGSISEPQTLYGSRSNTDSDFSYRLPSQDEDRLKFKIRSREVNTIRHICPLNELLLLTSSAEWRVSSINSDVLTSNSISVRPQSYVGCSNVQPEIINNSLLFCAARGGHVRELGYNWQSQGFVTSDISIRSAHLFDHLTIVEMCQSRSPHQIVWFISSSGNLLGLTYIPEEQVAAWHQHTTSNGVFKSCCTVSEGDEDILYVVTERTIGATFTRCIERLGEQQQPTALADSFFVDCGYTKTGAASVTVTGLDWLNGATVKVLADGKVHRSLVVSGGTITLDYAASTVQVGLGYDADLQTLPVAMQIDGLGQGRTKNVNKAFLRIVRATGAYIGPDANHLVKSNIYDSELETVRTDEVEVTLSPSWSRDGRIYLRHSDPLPFVITTLTLETSIGG